MSRQYLFACFFLLFTSCNMPTMQEAGLSYPIKPAFTLPENIELEKIGLANEMVNIKEKAVVLSGGANPIPLDKWKEFTVNLPWKKNIDRHLLIDKTALVRSPEASATCQGTNCFTEREIEGYSWIDLAKPVAIEFIPSKTDVMKPEPGYLTVKIIKKCQVVVFEKEIYQLSDEKGNKYVMHATESGTPRLDVVLPKGFSLKKVQLSAPLVIVPFGNSEDCYFNIVGDHLGQGYHQYEYAGEFFPAD